MKRGTTGRRKRWWLILPLAVLALAAGIAGGLMLYVQLTTLPPPVLSDTSSEKTDISPDDYRMEEKSEEEIGKGELILVNESHPYRFGEFEGRVFLSSVKNSYYSIRDNTVCLDGTAADALDRMTRGFYHQYHKKTVIVLSGWRDYEKQESLYRQRVEKEGQEKAGRFVAQAGQSEHHTGYALDFGLYYPGGISADYTGRGVYSWLNRHAHEYGYIVRYAEEKSALTGVDYEPWHFRYVGKPHAYLITQRGFCLEEYIEFLKGYCFGEKHLLVTDGDRRKYEIYYAEGTKVPVPKEGEYTVSGNNESGFIVTVCLGEE